MKPDKASRKKFDMDLQFGAKGENFIHDMLNEKGKVEVKTERDKWVDTGNIAIELAFRNNPSGINATESHWWAQVLTKEGEILGAFFFNTELLRKNIKKCKFKTVYGGDGNRSLLLLVPIRDLWKLMMPDLETKKDELV